MKDFNGELFDAKFDKVPGVVLCGRNLQTHNLCFPVSDQVLEFRIDFVRSDDARNRAEVSLNLLSRSVLENLRDRAALVCAQIGMNPLTVCLRYGSGRLSDHSSRSL